MTLLPEHHRAEKRSMTILSIPLRDALDLIEDHTLNLSGTRESQL